MYSVECCHAELLAVLPTRPQPHEEILIGVVAPETRGQRRLASQGPSRSDSSEKAREKAKTEAKQHAKKERMAAAREKKERERDDAAGAELFREDASAVEDLLLLTSARC
ncbi:unnamed protein product [Symbiodinium natans]|uniref:Uncharacterized protein n=1 Tax=Symbiodinium natans TaxID=878477 RepID=A0A812P3J1_9DINO|nr:unnamed protein product [Symbiodinium natans]